MPNLTENHQENMRRFVQVCADLYLDNDEPGVGYFVGRLARAQGPTLLDAAFRANGGPGAGNLRSKEARTAAMVRHWMDAVGRGDDDKADAIIQSLARTVSSWDLRRILDKVE